MNNPFEKTIETFERTEKEVDKLTREQAKEKAEAYGEDPKETAEGENHDPAYVLYNAISSTSVELLQNPTILECFKTLGDAVGEDVSKKMIEMFAIVMTQSAYQAIVFYDTLMKQQLDVQFNHFAKHINEARADIIAHQGALKVFREQLGKIEKELKLQEITSQNKITPDPNQ